MTDSIKRRIEALEHHRTTTGAIPWLVQIIARDGPRPVQLAAAVAARANGAPVIWIERTDASLPGVK